MTMDLNTSVLFLETSEKDALEHYGVLGMKWGKWNSETRRKYTGGGKTGQIGFEKIKNAAGKTASSVGRGAKKAGVVVGKKVGSGAKAVGNVAAKKAKEVVSAKLEQRKTAKEVNQMMDEAGLKKKRQREAFVKERAATLSAHDPDAIIKGMHTLTDAELSIKIDRLKKEDELLKVSANRKAQAAQTERQQQEALRAKYQAQQASLKGRMQDAAINAVKTVAVDSGKAVVERVLDRNLPKPEKKDKDKKNKDKKSESGKEDSGSKSDAASSTSSKSSDKPSSSNNASDSSSSSSQESSSAQRKPSADVSATMRRTEEASNTLKDITSSVKYYDTQTTTISSAKSSERYEYGVKWWQSRKKSK